MMRFWLGVALLAGSWVVGTDFYRAPVWPAWGLLVTGGLLCLVRRDSRRVPPLHGCVAVLLLIVPCDTPLLPGDLGRQLLAGHDGGERSVCVASDGEHLQPGCALIPKRLEQDLRDFLASGERRLGFWLRRQQTNEVVIREGTAAFLNLNSPEEMRRATQALQPGGSLLQAD